MHEYACANAIAVGSKNRCAGQQRQGLHQKRERSGRKEKVKYKICRKRNVANDWSEPPIERGQLTWLVGCCALIHFTLEHSLSLTMSGEKKEYKWSVSPGGSVPVDSVALKTAMGTYQLTPQPRRPHSILELGAFSTTHLIHTCHAHQVVLCDHRSHTLHFLCGLGPNMNTHERALLTKSSLCRHHPANRVLQLET